MPDPLKTCYDLFKIYFVQLLLTVPIEFAYMDNAIW